MKKTDDGWLVTNGGSWYEDALMWATILGIVNGYPDGTFRPDEPVTNEELCAVLARYYKLRAGLLPSSENGSVLYIPPTDYDEIAEWALESYSFCVSAKLVEVKKAEFDTDGKLLGQDEYFFDPSGTIKRSDFVSLLAKMFAPFQDWPLHDSIDGFDDIEGYAHFTVLEYVPYFKLS